MPGRNTSLTFHLSNEGHMVMPVTITDEDWQELQTIAGRALSSEQRNMINEELTVCRDMRTWELNPDMSVSRQDMKRTLKAISKMKGPEIDEAYFNCAQEIHAAIFEAMWFQFRVNIATCPDDVRRDTIAKAAAYVLDNLPESKGGRPVKLYYRRLAKFCCELWKQCGNEPHIYVWNDDTSPMVRFASILFRIVNSVEVDLYTIRELLHQAWVKLHRRSPS